MAKIKTRAFKSRSNAGATLIVRNNQAPIVTDEKSPFFGERPPLLNAAGEQVTITLLGPESDVARRLDNKRRADGANRYALHAQRRAISMEMTPEMIEQQRQDDIERAIAMTVEWTGMVDHEGSPVEFSEEEARALYTEDVDIMEQALIFSGDRAHFFDPLSTPSAPSLSTTSL